MERKPATQADFDASLATGSITRPGRRGGLGRRIGPGPILETRGPAASLARDSIFRRMLLGADILAIVAAFAVAIEISGGRLHLGRICLAGLPLVLLGAKLFGLYDRDEAVIRKTTLDELPKLVQVATLCALLAWLAERPLGYGTLTHSDVILLWVALVAFLVVGRCSARALALRVSPVERCLFVGSAASEQTIRSRLVKHGGVKAEIVAHVDLHEIEPWSADTFSQRKLAEIRDLATKLDVHRAIVSPSDSEAGEMLDLVRTLKAAGIRVSVVPRLLQVIGSSVIFDDLHGVTLMGVRRFDPDPLLGHGQASFRPDRRHLGPDGGRAPDDRDSDRDQARLQRSRLLPPDAGWPRRASLRPVQVPHDGPRGRAAQAHFGRSQRSPRGPVQDRRGPPRHSRRRVPAQDRPRRAAPVVQRPARRDEPGRARVL